MVQVQIMPEQNSDPAAPPPPPPPPHNRRQRVREVSSRFMSPSVPRRPRSEPDPDENSETPFPIISQRKQTQTPQQRSMKIFKENNNNGHEHVAPHPHPSKSCSGRIGTPCVSRPGTPTPSVYVSSRYKQTQQQHHHHHNNHHHHRFVNGMASAAEKLMQASGLNQAKSSDDSGVNCSIQSLPELGEREMLLQSNLSMGEKIGSGNGGGGGGDLKFRHPSPLSRSVTLPSSGGEHKPPSSVSKQHGSGGNQLAKSGGGLSLPPVPPQCGKPAVDVRKGKKGSSRQEDVHSLRLLYNRYLQWRFANAKAHSTMKAQQTESQKALYSQAMRISEMRDSVNKKRIELELLWKSKTLSTILEAQVDVGELGEALNSASKMMETMISNIQRFMPKAEETDISISELARVAGGERALVGECRDLLSKTYKSQLEECSLRGQLIQLHSICHKNKNEEQQTSN